MKTDRLSWIALVLGMALAGGLWWGGQAEADDTADTQPARLAVLWTSGDPDVAHRVCFMYTEAAARGGWFDQISLIVWGPSARLLAGDKDLQAKVKNMQDAGVQVRACVVCAESYGVSETLRDLGISVEPMGKPLTEMLQSDWNVLTF
jgi:hypothetical protein